MPDLRNSCASMLVPSQAMNAQLSLADEVHFCVTENHGVFLDLKADAYSAVLLKAEAEFGHEHALPLPALLAGLAPHRQALIEAGLLNADPAQSSPLDAYLQIRRPSGHIFGFDDQRAFGIRRDQNFVPHISFTDTADFVLACAQASSALGKEHISALVRSVRQRKAERGGRVVSREALGEQTAIFRRLRPWFPRDYLCLFDSLALVEFLARRWIFPDWVFGVQLQPFGAHCWVQADGLLLNEGLEYARQFTPIMMI